MNLDELMSVWQSQDEAPLHDVNKTLLHLALRQDEAALQKERRTERWIVYAASAGAVAAMAIFLAIMAAAHDRKVITGWDYTVAIIGAVAALLAGWVSYASHKRQSRREPRFGESLRDQLNWSIAHLDDNVTTSRWTLVMVLLAGICPIAILLLSWRINGKSISDDGYMIVWLILLSAYSVAIGVWELRRRTRNALPRKHRLEELLKEIDGP